MTFSFFKWEIRSGRPNTTVAQMMRHISLISFQSFSISLPWFVEDVWNLAQLRLSNYNSEFQKIPLARFYTPQLNSKQKFYSLKRARPIAKPDKRRESPSKKSWRIANCIDFPYDFCDLWSKIEVLIRFTKGILNIL